MVEVKSITVGQYHFAGIYINLPQYPIHFIISTHTILAQDNFSMNHIAKEKGVTIGMKAKDAVILCEEGKDQTI